MIATSGDLTPATTYHPLLHRCVLRSWRQVTWRWCASTCVDRGWLSLVTTCHPLLHRCVRSPAVRWPDADQRGTRHVVGRRSHATLSLL